MSHHSVTTTPRGTRRTIALIAMLAAALLAPSAAAANRHKVLPTGLRPIESKVLLRGADKNGTLHLVVTLRTPGIGSPRSAGGAAQPFALQGAQIRERISARAAITALGATGHGHALEAGDQLHVCDVRVRSKRFELRGWNVNS